MSKTTSESGIFLCFSFYAMVMSNYYEQQIGMVWFCVLVVFGFNSVSNYVFKPVVDGCSDQILNCRYT